MRFLIESISADQNEQITNFYQFVRETLNITDNPILTFVPSLHTTSFGVYSPSQASVTVATEGRHISDILRTFAHELVHHKQLTTGSELTLEELEYEANAVAGMLMRDYNKMHPEMFGVDVDLDVPPGTIADVGASHLGQDFPQTPTYEGGIADAQPMRPPYPIEIGENFNSSEKDHTDMHLDEEAVINSAGAGNVAGIGIGPQGEPGVDKRKRKSPIMAPMARRKTLGSLGLPNTTLSSILKGKKTFKQLKEQLEEARAHVVDKLDWEKMDREWPKERQAIEAALKKPKKFNTLAFLHKIKSKSK